GTAGQGTPTFSQDGAASRYPPSPARDQFGGMAEFPEKAVSRGSRSGDAPRSVLCCCPGENSSIRQPSVETRWRDAAVDHDRLAVSAAALAPTAKFARGSAKRSENTLSAAPMCRRSVPSAAAAIV